MTRSHLAIALLIAVAIGCDQSTSSKTRSKLESINVSDLLLEGDAPPYTAIRLVVDSSLKPGDETEGLWSAQVDGQWSGERDCVISLSSDGDRLSADLAPGWNDAGETLVLELTRQPISGTWFERRFEGSRSGPAVLRERTPQQDQPHLATTRSDGADDRTGGLQRGYQKALRTAQAEIRLLREFHSTFPEALASIGGFARSDAEPKPYTAIATLYGRYELFLQVPIETRDGHVREISDAQPIMLLREITDVNPKEHGGLSIGYGETWPIDKAAWGKLNLNKGRIEHVFEDIKLNQPVKNFELYEAYLKDAHAQ